MIVICAICGKETEAEIEPDEGQHVRCPFCNGKFSYHKPASSFSGEGLLQGDAKDSTPHQKKKKSGKSKCANINIYDVARAVVMVAILVVVLVVLVQQYFEYEDSAGCVAGRGEQETVSQPNDPTVNNPGEAIPDANGESQLAAADEPLPSVAAAAAEKNETLKLLRAYLSREEQHLKQAVAESKSADSEISVDQQRLSVEVRKIDEVCAKRQKEADNKGWRRYDKAERLLLVMKSDTINELAIKYIGEDLSALTEEFRGKMRMVVEMDKMTREGLARNRAKYAQMVANIDDDVMSKTQVAKQQAIDANKDLEKRLAGLQEKRYQKETRIAKLQKGAQSKYVSDEIGFLKNEIYVLDKEIVRFSEVVNVSRANLTHIAATEAETIARKKNDSALLVKTDEDAAVHAAAAHMRTVFDLATQYEHISLDKIRASMRSRRELLGVRMLDAQQKLVYIHGATANADIMDAADIKRLRVQVVDRLQESILKVTGK